MKLMVGTDIESFGFVVSNTYLIPQLVKNHII